MKSEVIKIRTEDGQMSEHIMIRQDNSDGLLIMFPGGNNSCDRPIMNLVKEEMLLNNYDVLIISYNPLSGGKQLPEERLSSVNHELVKLHTKTRIQDYSSVLILGRSVGNIIASNIRKSLDIEVDKHCFLAPIPGAIEYIIDFGGLVVTGTNDEYMTESSRQVLIDKLGANCIVIEGANHSFETNDSIDETLEITRDVGMKVVEYFV